MGRGAVAGLLLAAVLAACAESKPAPKSTTAAKLPNAIDGCGGTGTGWRAFEVDAPEGQVDGAILGTGDTAVVLANESGNLACDWMPLATQLAKRYRVVAFDYVNEAEA